MEALEILIPLTFFAMIAAIVIAPRYYKSVERQKVAETLRAAIERGQPLPPEVINMLTAGTKPAPSPQRDLRRGVVLVAVALGLVAMGLAVGQGEPDATYPLIGVSAIPGFIGLALIAMSLLGKGRS
jgi:Na+/H+ antiporter NhaD/arsenite permease-like protein